MWKKSIFLHQEAQTNEFDIQLMLGEKPSSSVQGLPLPCHLASDGHAQLLLGRRFLSCLSFIPECLFPAIPLFQLMPHFATQAMVLFPLQLPFRQYTPHTPPPV
ncbi:hypothetical protein CHARACLAT_002319 [Characodon lateralis]|uniref:Uncharacterized protein n=1 Tax=Characodon lateralis TaxID=208331 RepID=A0ABU7EH02_9TELE|nr:hypothetical protein [Characodon lateralis]